jgi:catechol 2,3-dioxygenase-like lactoylglutathione lyase family enzyme
MSRFQLALRVGDLEGSIAFYSKLFGVEPAKRRSDYANFVIAQPPMKLVLLPGEPGQRTVMDHLGVEVDTREEVDEAAVRFDAIGMDTEIEDGTACCYALQDKVWVHGPGNEPWEVYRVVAEADVLGKSAEVAAGH